VAIATVPPVLWLAGRLRAVDQPDARRIHRRPTPRLGGFALLLGFAAAVGLTRPPAAHLGGLLVAAVCLTVVMAYDDIRGMAPAAKLAVQTAVAVGAVALGITIDAVSLPAPIHPLGWLAGPVTVLWLVGMQNTVNLLDGVDGLAAGVVAIVAAALLLAAINVQKPEQVALAGALVGTCTGFLLFNRYPARIFMGDSGSHFLGFTLGALAILAVAKVPVVFGLFVPLLALALPIADTGWAILRRRRRGVPVGQGDTAHLHHQLLDLGLSQRETAAVFYFATGLCSAVGLTVYGHRKILGVVALLAFLGLTTTAIEHLQRRR